MAGATPARRGSSSSISSRRRALWSQWTCAASAARSGLTTVTGFPITLADLDALLDHLSPDAPLDLVGHSMGGNIVMLYAGVRPQRVRRSRAWKHFGLPRTNVEQAPARYAEWLDDVKRGNTFAIYDTYEQFMRVLARRNPRTPPDRLNSSHAHGRVRPGRPHRAVGRSETQARQSGAVSARPGPRRAGARSSRRRCWSWRRNPS
jgi:pimeloyl-ACP methyl ester carboxylesterase